MKSRLRRARAKVELLLKGEKDKAKPEWYNELSSSPFNSPQFTTEMMNLIMWDIPIHKKEPGDRSTTIFISSIIGASVISLALFFVIVFGSNRQ
ncbi:hypothetical protein [Paenibacillus glacialis]|uniref:hypothetical protein n=1 Tax=Paenibacillus glacialis TaxID=494026 RepID=UPI001FE14084|nr:hypothetical protein [Paenibacillus glacialis]